MIINFHGFRVFLASFVSVDPTSIEFLHNFDLIDEKYLPKESRWGREFSEFYWPLRVWSAEKTEFDLEFLPNNTLFQTQSFFNETFCSTKLAFLVAIFKWFKAYVHPFKM